MVLFPVYAVFVWYLCLRWRRTWVGWASLFLGVAGIGALEWFRQTLSQLLGGILDGPLFPLLLAAEAGLVLVVGAFIATLPTEVAQAPCRKCHYDLTGLEDDNPTCPECGTLHAARKVRKRACRACGAVIFAARSENPCCAECGIANALYEVLPPRPPVLVPALREALRAMVQPRTSRYSPPNSSTPKGTPRIVVIRRPDSTFASIG
jgi:hypothetical protein